MFVSLHITNNAYVNFVTNYALFRVDHNKRTNILSILRFMGTNPIFKPRDKPCPFIRISKGYWYLLVFKGMANNGLVLRTTMHYGRMTWVTSGWSFRTQTISLPEASSLFRNRPQPIMVKFLCKDAMHMKYGPVKHGFNEVDICTHKSKD